MQDELSIDLDTVDVSAPAIPAPANTASDKQVKFIQDLIEQRDLDDVAVTAVEVCRALWRSGSFDKSSASALIDVLKGQPRKGPAGPSPLDKDVPDPEAGVYVLPDGTILRVYLGQQSGRMLAKTVIVTKGGEDTDGEVGSIEYVYAGAATRVLTEGYRRMTTEEAGEIGHGTGVCVVCGRRLDDPESVERGIGPVCFSKM